MGRALLVIDGPRSREKAIDWIRRCKDGTRITFQASKRTLPQNSRIHAMITEIASQVKYHGQSLSIADWKILFLDALKREVRMVASLDGTNFVPLGRSTADLSKSEASDLMELIAAWAAQRGIVFSWEGKETK